jgi:hypothetical protein
LKGLPNNPKREFTMVAVNTKPFHYTESLQRKPLDQATASERLKSVAETEQKKSAVTDPAKAVQSSEPDQPVRPSTNTRGEKLGQLLNASA